MKDHLNRAVMSWHRGESHTSCATEAGDGEEKNGIFDGELLDDAGTNICVGNICDDGESEQSSSDSLRALLAFWKRRTMPGRRGHSNHTLFAASEIRVDDSVSAIVCPTR